jgi:hypothetical protein
LQNAPKSGQKIRQPRTDFWKLIRGAASVAKMDAAEEFRDDARVLDWEDVISGWCLAPRHASWRATSLRSTTNGNRLTFRCISRWPYNAGMRYRLRTLLILMAILPPLLWLGWTKHEAWKAERERERLRTVYFTSLMIVQSDPQAVSSSIMETAPQESQPPP